MMRGFSLIQIGSFLTADLDPFRLAILPSNRLPLSTVPDNERHVDHHTSLLDCQLASFGRFQNFGADFNSRAFVSSAQVTMFRRRSGV